MSDCWCDYEPAEWSNCRVVKARKPHRCDECSGSVAVGETYEYVAGKWEGYVGQFHTCAGCLALRQYVTEHVPCFCWAHNNMREDARETIENYAHELPGLWFGWARHEIRARQRNLAASRARYAA